MFQSALLYLQQFLREVAHLHIEVSLPAFVNGQQQSTRACQFLQQPFSVCLPVVGQAFLPVSFTPESIETEHP
jgi:hypothetical protein